MEYVVSARKYRPLTFDAVVGQATLTTTLKNAIKAEKLAHAYLFCGPRGVGKTTCARIFARAINCSNLTADGEACGECESCKAMLEQRSLNIFELDAASNNSVQDIRELVEQTHIPPQIGQYKVFIIDEVHMLTSNAFNAFLKTLEEPPAHVVFILATTEKHKVIPTILSRCQIYDFERISVQSIIDYLRMVAQQEGYTCEEEALEVIAEKADGAMRDALSIFDQVASFCQGNITYKSTIEDLNVLDIDNYFRIVELALSNNSAEIMLLLNSIIDKGFDVGNVCQGLAGHIRNVMMSKEPTTIQILELSAQLKARYAEQAQKCPAPFLYKALKILNNCEVNYRQASNKRLLVELTLIQISQITQGDDDAPSSGRRPTRLKTLFNNEAQHEPSKVVVQQVTTTAVHASTPSPTPASSAAPKKMNLGTTFASLSAEANKSDVSDFDEQSKDNADPLAADDFSQEMLETQWLSMCNRMQLNSKTQGLATRMKHLRPLISSFPEVEIVVENSMLLEKVKALEKRILSTLRKELNNHNISLVLRLAAPEEVHPKLSKVEIIEEMKKSNPAIELLFNNFNLELA